MIDWNENDLPMHNPRADYRTNSKSYYDALAKVNHLLVKYIIPEMNKYIKGEIKLSKIQEQISLTQTTIKNFILVNGLELKEDGLFVPDYEPLIKALDDKFKTHQIDAQKGVDEKLNAFETELETFNTLIQGNMTKTEFNGWMSTLLTGTPQLFKNSLADLQSAYPTGTTGIALVKGAGTDPGKLYIWMGSAWTYWGDYAGTVVNDKTITAEKLGGDVLTEITANNLHAPEYTPGGYYNQSDGVWTLSARHTSSNLIPCERLEWFFADTGSGQITFHDRNGGYISGYDITSPNAFQVPDNIYIKYIRKVIDLQYPNPYVCRGKYRNSYKLTDKVFQEKELNPIDTEPLKRMKKIEQVNKIDFNALTIGGYYNYTNGVFVPSLLATSTAIIPCKPGDRIYRDYLDSAQITYWDINGVFVTGENNLNVIATVPADQRIHGVRVNMTIGENVRQKYAWMTFSDTPIKTRYKLTSEYFEIEKEQVKSDFVVPYKGERNPIITPEMVTDRTGVSGVADPFIVNERGTFYMFFEVLSSDTGDEIGLAISHDLNNWAYAGIVLSNAIHGHRSAYPNVFKVDGEWYMLPDTGWDIILYKAKNFPYEWEKVVTTLLPGGVGYNDTNMFFVEDVWYLTTSQNGEGVDLYKNTSGDFRNKEWSFVKKIIANDANEYNMRGAGNPIVYDGYVLLPIQAQPSGAAYGQYTYLYKLTGLEGSNPLAANMGKLTDKQDDGGWADGAMHHVSKMDFNGKMLYAVDGWKAPNRYTIGLYQNG